MTTGRLSEEFAERGFVVIEDLIAPANLDSIKAAAARIVDEFDIDKHRSVFSTRHQDRDRDRYFIDSAESVHCFLEEFALDEDGALNRPKAQAINKIGHAMHDMTPEFTEFCRLPVFAELLHAIGFERPQLWQSMYIFKQPKIGGEVRWHQDASYLIAGGNGVIGLWVAIEDASRSNGCLWLQPGGHRSSLREIYEVTPDAETGMLRTLSEEHWPDQSDAVPVEVPAGSIVAFSDHMPHYSSQNFSDRSRQAMTMHFTELGAAWSTKNWLQRPNLGPFVLD